MKKYLIVTGILSFLLVSLICSYFFIPGIKEKFNFKITKVSETNSLTGSPEETAPDLSVNSKDFKQIVFNKLILPIELNSQIENSGNKINIKRNAGDVIEGTYYPLDAVRREGLPADADSLYSYNLSFKTPNNLGEGFLKDIFEKYVTNYQLDDSSFDSNVTLGMVTQLSILDPNLAAFYFKDELGNRAKVVALTKENLYIFNIKSSPENINKIEKTFYNISLVK